MHSLYQGGGVVIEPQISDEAFGAAAFAARRATASLLTVDQTLDVVHAVLAAAVPLLYQQWEAEIRAKIASEQEALRSRFCEEAWAGHSVDPDKCGSCDAFIAIARGNDGGGS